MTGKFLPPFAFRQVSTDTGRKRRALDEPRNLLIVEPLGTDFLALPRHPSE
jgi:hypothetical protein